MGDFNGENYNDKFIGDLVNFVAGDKFQTMFETFFLTHALKFTNDEEHRLEYYDLYKTFHDLFDEQLEDFCKLQGYTQTEFMKRCREASTQDEKAKHYIDILLSSVEYETFVKLMKIMRPVAELRASSGKTSAAANPKPEGKAAAGGYGQSTAKSSKQLDLESSDRAESKVTEAPMPVADAKAALREEKLSSK
mmetsp:Transcript_78043/g.153216  ORF Transcript_78043/g.153216 Transcript_78043/m.153216 type:complete len:193 (+) Transcript_78043:129-707(+)